MRRNSLILQKKFSTRCRHLYISESQGIVVTRLALGGITAVAPRPARSARITSLSKALLSKALSARRALKSRSASPLNAKIFSFPQLCSWNPAAVLVEFLNILDTVGKLFEPNIDTAQK